MSVVIRPLRMVSVALGVACALLAPVSAHAQRPKRRPAPAAPATPAPASNDAAPAPSDTTTTAKPKQGKPKVFDFTGIDISGQNRSPQLLYFLERANEELERASLERRSFIPEMVRSIEEDKL